MIHALYVMPWESEKVILWWEQQSSFEETQHSCEILFISFDVVTCPEIKHSMYTNTQKHLLCSDDCARRTLKAAI